MPSIDLRLQLAAELTHSDLLEVERAMREASARCRQLDEESGWGWELPDWRRYLVPRLARLFPPLPEAQVKVHGPEREFILRYFRDELVRALDLCLETRFSCVAVDLTTASPETLRKLACSVVGIPWEKGEISAQKSPLTEAVGRIVRSLQRIAAEAILATREEPKPDTPADPPIASAQAPAPGTGILAPEGISDGDAKLEPVSTENSQSSTPVVQGKGKGTPAPESAEKSEAKERVEPRPGEQESAARDDLPDLDEDEDSESARTREQVICEAVSRGLKGMAYCLYLRSQGLTTSPRLQQRGCPADYVEAYRREEWRRPINDEKSVKSKPIRRANP